jgi:hypothetical protein
VHGRACDTAVLTLPPTTIPLLLFHHSNIQQLSNDATASKELTLVASGLLQGLRNRKRETISFRECPPFFCHVCNLQCPDFFFPARAPFFLSLLTDRPHMLSVTTFNPFFFFLPFST